MSPVENPQRLLVLLPLLSLLLLLLSILLLLLFFVLLLLLLSDVGVWSPTSSRPQLKEREIMLTSQYKDETLIHRIPHPEHKIARPTVIKSWKCFCIGAAIFKSMLEHYMFSSIFRGSPATEIDQSGGAGGGGELMRSQH